MRQPGNERRIGSGQRRPPNVVLRHMSDRPMTVTQHRAHSAEQDTSRERDSDAVGGDEKLVAIL